MSLQTTKPLDDHKSNTHDNKPKPHMVFLEKRLSRWSRPGTSPAVDKNPEKHLAGTSSRSKDCKLLLVPVFEKEIGLVDTGTKVVGKQYKKNGGIAAFCSKLYAILPNFVAQRVKLDLAKHFHVLLCRSYESETCIFFLAVDGFYSPDRRPRDIREVRDEEHLCCWWIRRFTYGRRNSQSHSSGNGRVYYHPLIENLKCKGSLSKIWV